MTDMLPDDDQRLTRVERRAAEWAALTAERDQLRTDLANALARDIHTCHAGCTRAGCVNARLRAEVEALRRGEFICRKCGLRKDSELSGPLAF